MPVAHERERHRHDEVARPRRARPSVSGPSSTTSAENSWPITKSRVRVEARARAPPSSATASRLSAWCSVCRSEPQMPQARTATERIARPGTGSGTSSTTICPRRAIAARMRAILGPLDRPVKRRDTRCAMVRDAVGPGSPSSRSWRGGGALAARDGRRREGREAPLRSASSRSASASTRCSTRARSTRSARSPAAATYDDDGDARRRDARRTS